MSTLKRGSLSTTNHLKRGIEPQIDSSNIELSILIPAHNEEKRIQRCLERLVAFVVRTHLSSEIVVSEDGSRDRTVRIVDAFKERRHARVPITLLHSTDRLGKGGGLKRGMQSARGTYTAFTDTDIPVPLQTISQAVQALRAGADVVAGSRLIAGSSRDDPFTRRVLSCGFHLLARIMLGMRLDSQCGFKAVRTRIGRVIFSKTSNLGFAYDVEFLLQAQRTGAKVVELPVQWHYTHGSSMLLSLDTIGMFKELLHVFVQTRLQK